MVDACTITRLGGQTTDPFSGEVVDSTTEIYEGPCRFQQRGGQAQQETVGEAYLLLQRAEIQLPVSVAGVRVDDVVVCTASRDEDLVGRRFTVHDLAYKTDATSRRLQIQEVTS
jgi:hypothetical protein